MPKRGLTIFAGVWVVLLVVALSLAALPTTYAQTEFEQPTPTPEPTLTPTITPLPPIPAGALTATVVRASVLFARDAPFLGANAVGRMRLGETYAVVGRNDDATWYLLELGGRQGWAYGYYLYIDGNEFNATVANPYGVDGGDTDVIVQAVAILKLRAQPNVASEQIGRVTWGGYLPVLGKSQVGSWYKVIWKGTEGWVFAPYTQVTSGDLNTLPYLSAEPLQAAANPDYDISVPTATPAAG